MLAQSPVRRAPALSRESQQDVRGPIGWWCDCEASSCAMRIALRARFVNRRHISMLNAPFSAGLLPSPIPGSRFSVPDYASAQ